MLWFKAFVFEEGDGQAQVVVESEGFAGGVEPLVHAQLVVVEVVCADVVDVEVLVFKQSLQYGVFL